MVLPDAVVEVIDRLRSQGGGGGVLPAQAVAREATASGLAPENIDDIVRQLADSGVEVVLDEPSESQLQEEAVEPEPASLDDAGTGPSTDPVRSYLREIGRVPLLSAAEEVDLASRVEAGVFAAERLVTAPVPRARLAAELRQIEQDGKDAKQHIIEANLRLVVSIAKRYA